MKKIFEPQTSKHESSRDVQAEADEKVFREILAGVEGETVLYADDDPQLKELKGKSGVYETALSEHKRELSGSLDRYCSERDIFQSSLFMSAYAYMLRLFCSQKEVLFFAGESGSHGAHLPETASQTVHYLPVLVTADEEERCTDLLQKLQTGFQKLTAHGDADIAKLCSEYNIQPNCFFAYMGENRPAVVFKDETLTYHDLDDISSRIAGCLRSQGIGTGHVVSVLIPLNAFGFFDIKEEW